MKISKPLDSEHALSFNCSPRRFSSIDPLRMIQYHSCSLCECIEDRQSIKGINKMCSRQLLSPEPKHRLSMTSPKNSSQNSTSASPFFSPFQFFLVFLKFLAWYFFIWGERFDFASRASRPSSIHPSSILLDIFADMQADQSTSQPYWARRC
jgi:hypothetical protein